jgi:sialidase-1
MAAVTFLVSLLASGGNAVIIESAVSFQTDVYTSGTNGYAVYRIPAIVATTSGTLLAFAEGRKDGKGDAGRIDTVLRRSFDQGHTWGPLQVVWSDGANTCGNPAPVVDRSSGKIVLLGTWNLATDGEGKIGKGISEDTRRVFVSYSSDDGASWTGRHEITSSVKNADWRWYATGPCHGIQLEDGTLVIPANHTVATQTDSQHSQSHSHVLFSSDAGKTWRLGGSAGPGTNESTVAELDDGSLILNMRSYHGVNRRAVSWSHDGGISWGGVFLYPELVEPVCQGSLLRIPHGSSSLYLFSNPASKRRQNLTVRVSKDQCQTWSRGLVLCKESSAYSDLVPLPGGKAGCLYERVLGGAQPSARITFASFSVSALSD